MLASSYLILGTVPPIVVNIGGSNSPADDAAESGRLRHAAGLGGRPIESSNGGATSLSVRIRHGGPGIGDLTFGFTGCTSVASKRGTAGGDARIIMLAHFM